MARQRFEPGPGQESVWDYSRPPRLEEVRREIRVVFNDIDVAVSRHEIRVLETSHPPVYYLPLDAIQMECLVPTDGSSFCEWKGAARYYTVRVGDREARDAAWFYPDPMPAFEAIRNYVAFYPGRMDACYMDGERVRAQPGDFYGGWITSEIVGPFKGGSGSSQW